MWTVVYIARGMLEARRLKAVLVEEGLLVKLRTPSETNAGGRAVVELCVPAGEVRVASEIINARRGTGRGVDGFRFV